jgi:hypothetical protein
MAETTRATGKWSQAGVPHKGRICVDIEDLGESSATCEMCESQEIRYVHYMTHPDYPDYPDQLDCGCVCAGRMEEDYDGARRRETVLRNAAGRKRRWLTHQWRVSGQGNPYINADGYNLVVFPIRAGLNARSWGFRVTNRVTDDSLLSRKPYPTVDAAKLRAFDAIIWMKERGR